ncbi:Cytosine/adenosine deaminase [Streptococcus pneumoniae G54]|nr:Cytosine/adenosine deaminase [Streptococcus pneumoniae G54]
MPAFPNVVYGAKNQKFGAAGSLYNILTDERLNHLWRLK